MDCFSCGAPLKMLTGEAVKDLSEIGKRFSLWQAEAPPLAIIVCVSCGWFESLLAIGGGQYDAMKELLRKKGYGDKPAKDG